jgi:hypothetical protein
MKVTMVRSLKPWRQAAQAPGGEMITRSQIKACRGQEIDSTETDALKAHMATLRATRQPLFLTAREFEGILQWKLGQQIGRQRAKRAANTDGLIRRVTGLALSLRHPDKIYETELRLAILCVLRGVAVPVASAVLVLVFPEEYAVIDFRVWHCLFGEDRTVFTIRDYHRYMSKLAPIALDLGWPVQEVDHAIWEHDRRSGRTANGKP